MILVDVNLLIYAVNSDSPRHGPARRWLEDVMSGSAAVGLAWVVILAFVRITTRAGILQHPLPVDEALAHVDAWLRQPCVEIVVPGESHWPILCGLLRVTGAAGNLTSDAHLAALALERGAAICSTDHDFARFAGIRHINPLAAA